LIGDFVTNNIKFDKPYSKEICDKLFSELSGKNLISAENSLTWVAERLEAPLIMNKVELISDQEQEYGYTKTPFSFERYVYSNDTFMDGDSLDAKAKAKAEAKKNQDQVKKKQKENLIHKAHMEKMIEMKNTLPPIEISRTSRGTGSMDIRVDDVNLEVPGKLLLDMTSLIMSSGKKYGLIGKNGIGKTTLLYAMCRRELKGFENAPQILLVEQEIDGDEKTVIETVLGVDKERSDLMAEEKKISEEGTGEERLGYIYQRMEEIDAHAAEPNARILLIGLGFTTKMLDMQTKFLSGGWRMRVSLARVLFCEPGMLLLDEPTNHLDLNAVMWLQDYLINWKGTVLIVSHAREFLNNVCTDIICFENQQLNYYKGNYNAYEDARRMKRENQTRMFDAQQAHISHVQEFIDKFRYNAKRASLVQSRIKQLNRIDRVEECLEDPTTVFMFENPEKVRPPLIRVHDGAFSFDKPGAADHEWLLENLQFAVDMESKVALLGANGVGKTTFLNILTEKLKVMHGDFHFNARSRVAFFTQHTADKLDITLSPSEQFSKMFPSATTEMIRAHLGRYGVTGNLAMRPMYLLSGGQKSRVALALAGWGNPHVMIMDEPTNHLDIEAVDALIIALSNYQGGLIIVSHDQYFVSCICDQIWYIKNRKCKKFGGDFDEYRTALATDKL
jgi:ATP-binding cassette subfamily F protein 3